MSPGGPSRSILDPAPAWIRPGNPDDYRQYLILWHGCTSWDLSKIRAAPSGIDPRAGRPDADFGQGFYTTTWER